MADNKDDLLSGGGTGALPRFLSNMEAAQAAAPLSTQGGAPWTPARALTAGATGLAALLSSAFLAPEGPLQYADMASGVHVETLRIENVPFKPAQRDDDRAVFATAQPSPESTADQRLAFAANLGEHLQTLARFQEADRVAVSPLAPQAPVEDAAPLAAVAPEAEVPSLLIVRNLPEGVIFSEGVAAGIGAWAIGGQDPQVAVAAIEGGIEVAMTAEVDLIAPSGATLETRAIDLPARPKAVALGKTRTWQAANMRAAKAGRGKLGPKQRAAAFKRKAGAIKIAGEAAPKAKRRKRRADDAYRGPAPKASGVVETGNAGVQGEPAQEEGALSKFFSLFKGSGSSNTKTESTAAAKAPSREYDGSLRGLGMSPPD